MQKAKKIIVSFLSLFVFCPFVYGAPPKLLADSSLGHVVGNQPISRGKAPESLCASKPLSRPSRPVRTNGGSATSTFRCDPFNPPSGQEIATAQQAALETYVMWCHQNKEPINPAVACTLL